MSEKRSISYFLIIFEKNDKKIDSNHIFSFLGKPEFWNFKQGFNDFRFPIR